MPATERTRYAKLLVSENVSLGVTNSKIYDTIYLIYLSVGVSIFFRNCIFQFQEKSRIANEMRL